MERTLSPQEREEYGRAEGLRRKKSYQEAAASFVSLWEKVPRSSIGWRYAFCLRKLNRGEEALRVSREVVLRFPDDPFGVSEYGWNLIDQVIKPAIEEGNVLQALPAAEELWLLKPSDLLCKKLVLQVLRGARKGNLWDVALEWSGRVGAEMFSPESPLFEGKLRISERGLWFLVRSRALLEAERFVEARHTALEGLKIHPGDLFLRRTAALALAGTGNLDGAIRELRDLLDSPGADWYMRADLWELELRRGNFGEAIRVLCEVALKPLGDVFALEVQETLTRSLLALGRHKEAALTVDLMESIRKRNGWMVPSQILGLEEGIREALQALQEPWPSHPSDHEELFALCQRVWRDVATLGMEKGFGRLGNIKAGKKHTFITREDGKPALFVLLRDLPPDCREGDRVGFAVRPSLDKKKGVASVQGAFLYRAQE